MATEPAVLEGALALVLTSRHNLVVQFHSATQAERSTRYDAAVVSRALAGGVHADIVVVLPDTGSSRGTSVGRVSGGGADREVQLRSHQQVIDLLDEQFSLDVSRAGLRRGG